MPFSPQNLIDRAKAVGRDLETYAEKTASSISSGLQSSANIDVNGILSSVEGSASEFVSAINNLSVAFNANNSFSSSSLLSGQKYKGGTIENPLSRFASYNYVFTFGPLADWEINNPDLTYRKKGPSTIILQTGGTVNKQVQHLYDQQRGIHTEYFIDNVEVSCLMSPNSKTKQTNATSISFEVLEPYSMGMFLQTLQVAALKAGHKNYLEAPYLLTVEFVGWDDNGNPLKIPQTTRMFPIKLSNTTFNVTDQGSQYTVEALAWHEQAFADEVQVLKTDVDLQGGTIAEMLQTGALSLATQLNSRELEQETAKNKSTGDQYVFLFPTIRSSSEEGLTGGAEDNSGATTQTSASNDAGGIRDLTDKQKQDLYQTLTGIENGEIPADFDAEINKILGYVIRRNALGEAIREYSEAPENINKIGLSKIAKSYLDSGKSQFGKPGFVKDKDTNEYKRGNITISTDLKKLQFAKGTKIQDIIEELVLLSEYGRQFVTETPDENGMKKWFRIETDVYNVTDSANVEKTGTTAKVYVYRVIPYGVQTSRLTAPSQPPPGIQNLMKQALKEYNYIYTGANDDILRFDINIDAAFYNAIQSDFGQLHKDRVLGGSQKMVQGEKQPIMGANEGRSDALPKTKQVQSVDTDSGNLGGGTEVHPETQIARSFNEAIVNSDVDLVSADMEILGDPYYIADSGMGNYSASEVANAMNITSDGSMDYQSSEVDIIVNFRTPLDIGKDGFMDFPSLGTRPVAEFSGLYQVVEVHNKFSGGKFTQELKTIRRRDQEQALTASAVTSGSEAVIEKGEEAAIAPVPDMSSGSDNGSDASAGSIGGTGGASSQGSSLSSVGTDISGAINTAKGAIDDLTKGKLPAGLSDAAKQATDSAANAAKKAVDTASGIFGNDPGGA